MNTALKKYRVLTGLCHSCCKPYITDQYWKALIALLYRKVIYQRGWIVIDSQWRNKDE